jgi:hypothetical protein
MDCTTDGCCCSLARYSVRSPETFYADYGTDTEAAYLTQLLGDLADIARQNRARLARRHKVLALATRGPILLAVLYGLLSLT